MHRLEDGHDYYDELAVIIKKRLKINDIEYEIKVKMSNYQPEPIILLKKITYTKHRSAWVEQMEFASVSEFEMLVDNIKEILTRFNQDYEEIERTYG